jgi:hypothetical protein
VRKGLVAYLIFGTTLLALYGVGGFSKWWRGIVDLGGIGSGGSGRSFWGPSGGGGFRGGK